MKFFPLLALASVVAAHFQLNYPPTRGFDDDKEPTPICGGFDTINNRTDFPLSGGQLQITSFHTLASVFAEISFNSNPTSFTQFNTSSNGTNYPFLIPVNQIPEGAACWNVDVSALNVTEAKDGTNATIVIIFDGGDGTLYQCADLVLRSNATIPSGSIQSGLSCKTLDISASNSTGSGSTTATGANPTKSGSAAGSNTAVARGLAFALFGLVLSSFFV